MPGCFGLLSVSFCLLLELQRAELTLPFFFSSKGRTTRKDILHRVGVYKTAAD